MKHSGSPDDTWKEVALAFAELRSVKRIEFPRASSSAIVQMAAALPKGQLEELGANSVGPKEVDLASVANTLSESGSLKLLRLRGVTGKIKLTCGLTDLSRLLTLTKLVRIILCN